MQINSLESRPLQNPNPQVISKDGEEILIVCAQFRLHHLNHNNSDERSEFLRVLRSLEPSPVPYRRVYHLEISAHDLKKWLAAIPSAATCKNSIPMQMPEFGNRVTFTERMLDVVVPLSLATSLGSRGWSNLTSFGWSEVTWSNSRAVDSAAAAVKRRDDRR
ncbi:hypothetical protein LINPERHAP1_LOCUS26329, partial [Linum perenne]